MARLALGLFRLFARLSLRHNHALGALLGRLFARVPNRHRTLVRRNLALCYPELGAAARARLARACLIETGKTAIESPLFWFGDAQRVRGMVTEVQGEALFLAAKQAGRGVVVIAPHMGSWELVSLYLSQQMPITSLYRPLRQPGLEHAVVAGRKRFGAALVPTDARGVRALLQALARGEAVGIPPDQDPRAAGGGFAPFFGIPANTMTLIGRLLRKSGATPLFCVARRLPGGAGFVVHFLPAEAGLMSDDEAVHLAALNRGVERCIALDPAQYQWSYKRFRTRPHGEPRLY